MVLLDLDDTNGGCAPRYHRPGRLSAHDQPTHTVCPFRELPLLLVPDPLTIDPEAGGRAAPHQHEPVGLRDPSDWRRQEEDPGANRHP